MSNFTYVVDHLDLAQAVLPVNNQVRNFTKGIIDPTYQLVVSKIRDIMQENCIVNLQEFYSAFRTEDNWINEEAFRAAQASNVHQDAMGVFNIKNKPSKNGSQGCTVSGKSSHDNDTVKNEDSRMLRDRRWHITEKDNAKSFSLPCRLQFMDKFPRRVRQHFQSGK